MPKYDDGIGLFGVITASSLPMFLFEFVIRMLFCFVFALRPLQESKTSSVIGSVRGKQTSQRGKRQAMDVQSKYEKGNVLLLSTVCKDMFQNYSRVGQTSGKIQF